MSDKAEPNCCPKCGAPIPAEAPAGLCPKCLLVQAALPTEAGPHSASKSAPPTQAELARAFPQLEILELIGQGGMGFVFKARQRKLQRLVALKILPQSLAADPAFAERFTREGRLLAQLSHPNIVTIHDFGKADGFFYLLMEFVDGVNLRQAMRIGRFTPAQALAIVPKICEALQFAHNEGILHRDIKPENILLDAKGRVKIADFGIAKLMDAEGRAGSPLPADVSDPLAPTGGEGRGEGAASALTATGKILGTPHYMAPEQLEKPQEVDHRADIYSLGVVFYEMLTGELPLGRFAPPSEKSTADPRLDEVVFHALEKDPGRRTQTAGEVKTQVETISGTGPAAGGVPRANSGTASSSISYERLWNRNVAAILATVTVVIFAFGLTNPLLLLFLPIPFVILIAMVFPGRIRMERRARALLAQHPDAERTSVYLAFRSGGWTAKQREMDAKIAEMASEGWTFLRAAEANPFRTIRSWGGGLTLHFIRTNATGAPVPLRAQGLTGASVTSAPRWMRLVGIAFLGAGAAGLLPTLALLGAPETVIPINALLALTGIALLTRNRVWRAVALVFNVLALMISLYAWTISAFIVLFALGTVILCRRDVRNAFDQAPLGERTGFAAKTALASFMVLVLLWSTPRLNDQLWQWRGQPFPNEAFPNIPVRPGPKKSPTYQPGSASAELWAPSLAPGEKPDAQKIETEMQTMTAAGHYEQSLQMHIWYHNHALEYNPDQRGVRLSFALADWIELGRNYPKARTALLEIRNRTLSYFDEGGGTFARFEEVASINHYLQNEEPTLELFDKVEKQDKELAKRCFSQVRALLVKHGMYARYLEYQGDPQKAFYDIRAKRERMRPVVLASADPSFIDETCQLIEVLVGTGQKPLAESIRDQAVAILDNARLKAAVTDAEKRINK